MYKHDLQEVALVSEFLSSDVGAPTLGFLSTPTTRSQGNLGIARDFLASGKLTGQQQRNRGTCGRRRIDSEGVATEVQCKVNEPIAVHV